MHAPGALTGLAITQLAPFLFCHHEQGFQQVPASTNTLMPNDALITICTFNSSADMKWNITYGLTPSQEVRRHSIPLLHACVLCQSMKSSV